MRLSRPIRPYPIKTPPKVSPRPNTPLRWDRASVKRSPHTTANITPAAKLSSKLMVRSPSRRSPQVRIPPAPVPPTPASAVIHKTVSSKFSASRFQFPCPVLFPPCTKKKPGSQLPLTSWPCRKQSLVYQSSKYNSSKISPPPASIRSKENVSPTMDRLGLRA